MGGAIYRPSPSQALPPSTGPSYEEELDCGGLGAGQRRTNGADRSDWECFPYGLSVRVNAKDALPDELKYKDGGTSGSELIELTWPQFCMMAGLPGDDRLSLQY